MLFETPVVVIHFAFLGLLLLGAILGRKRAVGPVCWWIGFVSAALATIGLAGFLVLLLFSGGFIPPIAFAGGFFAALVGYGVATAIFWASRPEALRLDAARAGIVVLGFFALNATWVCTPKILQRSVVVTVATHNKKPIVGARISFKPARTESEKVILTDAAGRAVIPMPYMATIEGQISAEGYGGQSIYIAPNRRNSGGGLNIIQKPETKFLGELPSMGGMFLYSTPVVASLSVDVYLQKIGEGFPLPHRAIADLAGQMREAQAKGGLFPFALSSGDAFNPEMKAQSPDAYRQMKALIAAYDPKGPLRSFAGDYWNYLSLDNDQYVAQLKKIAAMPDADANKAANAAILAALLDEDVRGMSARDAVAAIERRLQSDHQLLKSMGAVIQ